MQVDRIPGGTICSCRTHSWPMAAALCFLAAGCATTSEESIPGVPKDQVLPVVAVSSFENRSGFPGEWQLGSGMADLLVSELVDSRGFVVVERQHLNTLVGELDRQRNSLFRPEGKVDLGRLKNAQYFIRGVINDFSQVAGGSFSVAWRWMLFGGRTAVARVSLTMTIVDVETGEVINAVQAVGLARARETFASGQYKGVSFGGDAFFKTPLGVATRNAIRHGVRGIRTSMPHRAWRPMIASANGTRLILNGGRDRGFREGQEFRIRESAQPVTDPATGDVLAFLPGPEVGVVRVIQVDEHISFADAVKGAAFRRGQHVDTR